MDENRELQKRLNGMITKAVNYRQNLRDKEYINNEAHYEGLHWNLADAGEESPFIVKSDINHLKNTVSIRLGSLYANTYTGDLKPTSLEDVESINTLSILYKNEWKKLKIDSMVESVIKNAAVFDLGYLELGYDPDKIVGGTRAKREGVITCKVIPTTSIYLDPSADSTYNCDYMVKRESVSKNFLEREYPDWIKKLKSLNISEGSVRDNEHGSILTGRDYVTEQTNLFNLDTIYEKVAQKVDIPMFDEMGKPLVNEKGEPVVEKLTKTGVKIHYLINGIYMETNEDYPFDTFPIIPLNWEEIPQCPYGIPLLRGLTIPQKIANLIESATNNIVIHYTVPTWLISDDSGLDVNEVAELINAVGVVWKVNNIEGAIRQLEPPKLDDAVISMGATFVGYIREYGGANAAYQGDIGTAGATAEGASAAIGRATLIDNEPMNQITKFVESVSRMLIKFMTHYYQNKTIYVRSSEENGNYTFNSFLVEAGLEDLDYDFAVDLATRSKADKNRQYNLTKEIYQLQNQYKDQTPVVKVTDVVKAAQLDNYNEIYNRLQNMTEETLTQKANVIVDLMTVAQTKKPDGTPLIDAQILQQGILDVLNDDNSLELVDQIFNSYDQYQTAVTDFKMKTQNMGNNMNGNMGNISQNQEISQ